MAQTALGLDIGNASIKYVEVKRDKQPELLSYGLAPSPSKGIASEAEIDKEAIVESIKKLLKSGGARTNDVILSLPESKVFTRVIEVPNLSENELANSIHWEAEQYIPMPLDEVHLDFSKLRDITSADGAKKQEVLLVAAPKKIVSKYQHIVELCGLTPVALETDVLATVRSLLPQAEKLPTVMIVNIGALSTTFAILKQGVLSFTRSIEVAGIALSRAIAQEFNFELSQAEEYKKAYGLDQSKLEGKVVKSLSSVYITVVDELKRAIAFHEKKTTDGHIATLILTGGTALLPGLVTSLAQELSLEVQIGNPWTNFSVDPKRFPKINEQAMCFAVACGLALREQ